MHIAAVMAALQLTRVDRTAKHALVVVCCRANRHTGVAVVSRARLAADMNVHPNTAGRALSRLVDMGYLTVDKRLGKTSIWTIDPHHLELRPSPSGGDTPSPSDGQRRSLWRKEKEAQLRRSGNPYKPTGDEIRAALDPATIAACPGCDEYGWLWQGDTIHSRCNHQRVVTDLTVADLLSGEPMPRA